MSAHEHLQPEQFSEWDPWKHLNKYGGRDYLRAKRGSTDFHMPEHDVHDEPGVYSGPRQPTRLERVQSSEPVDVRGWLTGWN